MYKRLKRLEKFDDSVRQKNKSTKPKLVSSSTNGGTYSYVGLG